MDPEPKPGLEGVSPERLGTSQPPRRSRRGGRGHRGRGRRPPQVSAPQPPSSPEEAGEPTQPGAEPAPVERETPPSPIREPRPAEPMAVTEAIEEVNHIIETLRSTLNEMEDVLETLELAERQKTADEQEIETLRRGLRQLHRPREGGQHPPRH